MDRKLFESQPIQRSDQVRRRWFSDGYFDLIVWTRANGDPVGFQLCYDVGNDERVVTWHPKTSFNHDRIDSGESDPRIKKIPVLVPDGAFSPDMVLSRLKDSSVGIDAGIRDFVLERLAEYPIP